MSNVVKVDFGNENGDHWIGGEAVCFACKHTFVIVAPVGSYDIPCPECGCNKGVFKSFVGPVMEEFWECECGCEIFRVGKQGCQCISCGEMQSFD